MVTQRVKLESKRVLPVLANGVAYFHSTVHPLFSALLANLKAYIEDINLKDKTEDDMILLLKQFF